MNILVCGADGFIGRHLCAALTAAGLRVVRGVRRARGGADLALDFARDVRVGDWLARLEGIDAVVNAVGILAETAQARFDAVQRAAPSALFTACEQAGVRRVIQISALGRAGPDAPPYLQSKRAADAHLMRCALDWIVLRPSLVVGLDGASSRWFRQLASLPLIGLPGRGQQRLQPVHVDDLCEAVLRALSAPARRVIDVVGPAPMTYRAMLAAYRGALGLPAPRWLALPPALVRAGARLAERLPQPLFSRATLRMLDDGNVADPAALTALLGRPPVGAEHWLAGVPADLLRWQALAGWIMPLLRAALALVWLATGLLSLGLYPPAASLALLAQVGLHGGAATAALYGAALLDCGLGLATLAAPGRALWRAQAALILGYTLIITLCLPAYWLHPFGPLLKNIPLLAILMALDGAATDPR